MSDIFLSYAREDTARAQQLARALESRRWSVWWDRRILHGTDYTHHIQTQLDAARCIIVLWSASSVASPFVRDEANEGLPGRLVPALLEKVKPPLGFRNLQVADLSGWHGDPGHDEFDRLLESIAAIVPATPILQPEMPPSSVPRPVQPEPVPQPVVSRPWRLRRRDPLYHRVARSGRRLRCRRCRTWSTRPRSKVVSRT